MCLICICWLQLYIPKEGVCIAFSPSGVRAPQRATQGQQGRPAATAEPFSEESFAFTRQHCLQREVRPYASQGSQPLVHCLLHI